MVSAKDAGAFVVSMAKVASALIVLCSAAAAAYAATFGSLVETWGQVKDALKTQETLLVAQTENTELIRDNSTQIAELISQFEVLEQAQADAREPSLQFALRDNVISNGVIGGLVQQKWYFYKLRDCGRPRAVHLFSNGDGAIHYFVDVSVVRDGRGVAADPKPTERQAIKFTARIPNDEGVKPGRAYAWVEIDYPDKCPHVPTERSPDVQFQILETELR